MTNGRTVLARFLELNTSLSVRFARIWPGGRHDVITRYKELVAESIGSRPGQLVVDVGGGRTLDYRTHVGRGAARIVAVDVSDEELQLNEDVDEKRVADVTRELPFADAEVDLITSSSVLEHLPNVLGFLDEAARVLRDDGTMIHLFPSRRTSYALLNRALPEALKRRLLFSAYPDTCGICGFPAHYDHCYYSAFTEACRERGFAIESIEMTYYGSSDYYRIFFPVFIVSWCVELALATVGARDLAAALLVKARRLPRPQTAAQGPVTSG